MGGPVRSSRATGATLTSARLGGESREAKKLAPYDEALAGRAYPNYGGDVFMLVASAKSIHENSFLVDEKKWPRRRVDAAKRLLAILLNLSFKKQHAGADGSAQAQPERFPAPQQRQRPRSNPEAVQ